MKKIHTKTIFDIETLAILEDHHYEYSGPIEKCCGGDPLADQKKAAANSQLDLEKALTSGYTTRNNAQTPFLIDREKNGLPYFNDLVDYNSGTLARAAAPQRASLLRRLSGFGDTLPSGFKEGVLTDFNSNLARGFDDSTVAALNQNEAAKENAANMLNPLGYASTSTGSANSVANTQVQPGGFGNFLGGLAAGAVDNFAKGAGAGAAYSI